jgi:hypothetical protein
VKRAGTHADGGVHALAENEEALHDSTSDGALMRSATSPGALRSTVDQMVKEVCAALQLHGSVASNDLQRPSRASMPDMADCSAPRSYARRRSTPFIAGQLPSALRREKVGVNGV